jgi:hypothetical protein
MKLPLLKESRLVLLFGLVLGTPAAVLVPPLVTYDGPTQYFRALQVSEGTVRAGHGVDRALGGILPSSQCDFVTTLLWNYYTHPRRSFLDRERWHEISSQSATVQGSRPVEFTNTAIYSPVNYGFQALGVLVASGLSREPLLAVWMGCLFNLMGYLLLVVFAIECAPRFRRCILLMATTPLLLIQAASISADAINFALPLLVLAWTWRLRSDQVKHPRSEFISLLALGVLVALLKPTLFAILPCLLLVPARYFGGAPHAKALGLLGYFILVLGAWALWNRPYLDTDIALWFDRTGQPMAVQKELLRQNPLSFIPPFLNFLRHDLVGLWPHLYGDDGNWVSPRVYELNVFLSLVFLPGFLGSSLRSESADLAWAGGMAAVALGMLVLTALTLWVAFGNATMETIPDLAGRYLFLPAMGVGIACAEVFHRGKPRTWNALYLAALGANAAGLAAVIVPVAIRTW